MNVAEKRKSTMPNELVLGFDCKPWLIPAPCAPFGGIVSLNAGKGLGERGFIIAYNLNLGIVIERAKAW